MTLLYSSASEPFALPLTQAYRHRLGLESDATALGLSLPLRLLFNCPSHSLTSLYSFCVASPFPILSLIFLFVLPLLFLLNALLTLIPFMWGTPGNFFNTANARWCVLVHCLARKLVLYAIVLCQCSCIFVNRRSLASSEVAPLFT
jgi:hypothetical protein